jgi:hypothetical protein
MEGTKMHKALLLILPLMMFPVPSGLDAESKAQRTPPSLAPQKIKYDKTAAEVTSSDKPYTSDPKIDIRAATGASLNLSQNSQTPVAQDFKVTGVQKVKLYFLREATKIVAILNAFAAQEGSDLHGLLITNATEDEIILYGDEDKRRQARRVIATLDLPLPGINMEMWGVQISSNKPEKMAEVILELREQINGTQQAVRDLYEQMQKLAREVVKDCDTPTEDNRRNNCLDPRFRGLLEETLGYRSALDSRRRLSLLDILLRLIAAEDPSKAAKDMALRLGSWLTKNHPYGVDEVRRVGRQPFERSMRTLGLHYEKGQLEDSVTEKTVRARLALLEFAVQYGRLVHEPESFSPYYLQQSADVLNSRLQGVVAALNLDMEDLFVTPTLKAMQSRVLNRSGGRNPIQ